MFTQDCLFSRREMQGQEPKLYVAPALTCPTHDQPASSAYANRNTEAVAWTHAWPEAIDFYTLNLPDYTGLDLYDQRTRYPKSHKELFQSSWVHFTLQILFAERARPNPSMGPLMHLKGWLLNGLKADLANPQVQRTANDLITEANALALYELIYEDDEASLLHLQAVHVLVQHHGGLNKLVKEAVDLIRITDALFSYLKETPPRLPRETELIDISYGVHQLRLALQPTESKLSKLRLRSFLLMSYGSPAQLVFQALGRLQDIALALPRQHVGTAQPRKPSDTLVIVRQIEEELDSISDTRSQLPATIFSDADRHNHSNTYELTRLAALTLVQRFKMLACNSDDRILNAHLDHAVQRLLTHVLSPDAYFRSLEVLGWALFIGVSFLDYSSVLREHAVKVLWQLMLKMKIRSLTEARAFLESLYFCAPLQETSFFTLFVDFNKA